MDGRADLINQLAASMGAGSFAQTKYEESRFDTETGTLYCDGMVISRSIAEKAIQHFEMLEKKCDKSDSAGRQMAMIYKCASESIKILQNPEIKKTIKAEADKNKLFNS